MAVMTKTYTVIRHEAEEGGYWGEVLELPGCVSQGETLDEFQRNIREAIEAVLQAGAEASMTELQIQSVIEQYRVTLSEPLVKFKRGTAVSQTWTAAS